MHIVSAQRRKNQGVLLNKTKPSVYLSFVKYGKLEPWYEGLSGERVWLRLHNNTRWEIVFDASGVADEEQGEASLYYDVVKDNCNEIHPDKYPCRVCSRSPLSSGESLLFSVPREHLPDKGQLRIHFAFDWQEDLKVITGEEIDNIVTFYSSDLPKETSKK